MDEVLINVVVIGFFIFFIVWLYALCQTTGRYDDASERYWEEHKEE